MERCGLMSLPAIGRLSSMCRAPCQTSLTSSEEEWSMAGCGKLHENNYPIAFFVGAIMRISNTTFAPLYASPSESQIRRGKTLHFIKTKPRQKRGGPKLIWQKRGGQKLIWQKKGVKTLFTSQSGTPRERANLDASLELTSRSAWRSHLFPIIIFGISSTSPMFLCISVIHLRWNVGNTLVGYEERGGGHLHYEISMRCSRSQRNPLLQISSLGKAKIPLHWISIYG